MGLRIRTISLRSFLHVAIAIWGALNATAAEGDSEEAGIPAKAWTAAAPISDELALCGNWRTEAMDDSFSSLASFSALMTMCEFYPTGEAEVRIAPKYWQGTWRLSQKEDADGWRSLILEGKAVALVVVKDDRLRIRRPNEPEIAMARATKWKGKLRAGMPDGIWKEVWSRDDSVFCEMALASGVQQGATITYCGSRKVSETPFVGGRMNGVRYLWDSHGKLYDASTYVDGRLHGLRTVYDEHGNIMGELEYMRGIPWNGRYVSLYGNGGRMVIGLYKSGERVGNWTTYNDDGTIHDSKEYGIRKRG